MIHKMRHILLFCLIIILYQGCLNAMDHSFEEDSHNVWTKPKSQPSYKCIALLTGYPEITHRKYFAERILKQLSEQFDVNPRYVHVFCQGKCHAKSFDTHYKYNYHSLENNVNRTLYRGFIIAENYKMMFKELFAEKTAMEFTENFEDDTVENCLMLEDDLILSPDAIDYLNAGVEVMKKDNSVFTVSLYNDNAYPWCASNTSFFRRIDHFSGLGFIMNRRFYKDLVLPNWDNSIVWDNNLQMVQDMYDKAAIQPEVNRVLHAPFAGVTNTNENRHQHSKYSAHFASAETDITYDLEYLTEKNYMLFLTRFIESAMPITRLEDAGFYDNSINLIHTSCDNNRCVDEVLRSFNLQGGGLGGMIRGVYMNSIFLRMFGNLILIIPKISPLKAYILKKRPRSQQQYLQDFPHLANITEKNRGIIRYLEQTYHIFTNPDESDCTSGCQHRKTECSRAGLWYLNSGCEVLQYFIKGCAQCNVNNKFGFPGPSVEKKSSGLYCNLSEFRFQMNCNLPVAGQQRVCACVKKGLN